MTTRPSKNLDTFPNPHSDRDYIIEIECPEFTCLCPKTGQPDFASLSLEYVPERLCVELKSLKLYIWSFRDEGHFHEDVTNQILNDLVSVLRPRYLRLRAKFNVRGGLYTTVEVMHRQKGWVAPPAPPTTLPRETQTLPGRDDISSSGPSVVPTAKTRNPVRLHAPTKTVTPLRGREPVAVPPPEPDPKESADPGNGSRFRMLRRSRRNDPEPESEQKTQVAQPIEPEEPPPVIKRDGLYIGIDIGTTGCRAIAVDDDGAIKGEAGAPIPGPVRKEDECTQDPAVWWKAVTACLQNLIKQVDAKRVRAIAVDGTSGTMLLCDIKGNPVTPAIMYNDQRAGEQAKQIASLAGKNSGAHGATSSLAKLVWLHEHKLDKRAQFALHQADWITGKLTGRYGHSEYNNSLKLGFDAVSMEWPTWINKLGFNTAILPEVHTPGETLGTLSAESAKLFGLSTDVEVLAGTTDGVAAFLAAGATDPGHAVTSLGTTLVLKLLSEKPVFSPEHGVYSHRLGKYWLAGGASNSGGAVLLQYFKVEQMREMSHLVDPETFTDLDYYPLPEIGERFPVNNPEMQPRLEPLPGNSVTFFQGMLEGIARIEAQGYELLHKHGAPQLSKVYTTGGGSQNAAWGRIRERILQVKMDKPRSGHAAYGAALLASGVVNKTFR